MDKTEEKVVDIAGLQKILQENDYTSILFSDSDEWTKEQKDALDILLQYTDSKPSFDYTNDEDVEKLFESIGGYLWELVSKIPQNQKENFYKSIDPINVAIFFDEQFIKDCPELYSIFMSNFLGNEEYEEIFQDDYADSFGFLSNCPELMKKLDSFPTYNKVSALHYYGFLKDLSKNLYANLPDSHKGKALLSFFKNTKIENSFFGDNFRLDFTKNVINDDFRFSDQDYKQIINDFDEMINNEAMDKDFFNTVAEHLSDENKRKFASHVMSKAIKHIKEQKDNKTNLLYDDLLAKCMTGIDISTIGDKEKIIQYFINNNLGGTLGKVLETCSPEDTIRYFEEFISKSDKVEESKNGIVKAFVQNLDFENYDISAEKLTTVTDYIMGNCEIDSLKLLLKRCPQDYKQPVVEYILKSEDMIIDTDKGFRNGKASFLNVAIKAANPGEFDKYTAYKIIFYALGWDIESDKPYGEKANELMKDFGTIDFSRREMIDNLLPKIEKEELLSIFKHILAAPYMITNDSEFNSRSSYGLCLRRWLNELPPDLIEEYIQNTNYITDQFIQHANREPEQYGNVALAVKSMHEKAVLPDMKEFDKIIQSGKILNPKEMDEYYKKIDQIRAKDGIIPEKYCDFAIKNTILSKEQKNDPESEFYRMFTLCVVDKARYVLKQEGLEDIIVYADNLQKAKPGTLETSTKLGSYSDALKELNLSDDITLLMEDGVYDIINTIFHETQHAIQSRDIKNNSLQNASEYDMIKEDFIRKDSFFFYKDNYKLYTAEIDARIAGRQKMYQYLLDLGIPVKKILEGDIEFRRDVTRTYEEYMNEEIDTLNDSNKKFTVNFSEEKTLDTLFEELVAKNPSIIKEKPALQYEFNDDGTRKSSLEMLQEYETLLSDPGYVPPKFILQEHLINKSYKGNPDVNRSLMLKDAEILKSFSAKTEQGKQLADDVARKMLDYIVNIQKQAEELMKNNNKDKARELLDDSDIILSAIKIYQDRKMMQELMAMEQIDSMVTDKQRAEVLAQIKDDRQSNKEQDEEEIKLESARNEKKTKSLNDIPADDNIEI